MIIVDQNNIVQCSAWKIERMTQDGKDKLKIFISSSEPNEFIIVDDHLGSRLIDGVEVPDYTKKYSFENNSFVVI